MTIAVQTTTNNYVGNGITKAFPFTFRCDDSDHLRVYKNGVLVTSGITYSGLGNNAGGTVTFTTAPADGDTIFIFRDVALERTTDYTEGAAIPSGTLDNDVDAVWMALQDQHARSFDFDGEGNLDVGGLRIVNVGDPVNAQDVATKTWSETSVSSQVGIATSAATEASGYALEAKGYRDTASTHATTATNKASEASGYADSAEAYRDTASTHATTATNKAGEASGYADDALGYRNTASTHATTATNKAGEASGYADAASLSATNAAASYDSFDDRYLGSKATDPSVDNDGNALLTGALYWNSSVGEMRVYNGTAWVAAYVSSAAYVNVSGDTITGDLVINGNLQVDTHTILGNQGTEGSGINVGGVTYESTLKVSDISGTNLAQTILHRHSTTLEPVIVGARSNSNDSSHVDVVAGQNTLSLYGAGWAGSNYKIFGGINISTNDTGTISDTSAPGKIEFLTTPDGSTSPQLALSLRSNKSAVFLGNALFPAGTVGAPSISFSSDAGTGLYSSAANNITFTTNSTARMQLNNSGLCIGDYLAASMPLEVWKTSDTTLARFARGSGTNNPRLEIGVTDATKLVSIDATGSTSSTLQIMNGGTAYHHFRNDGRVGINSSGDINYTCAISSFSNSSAHTVFNVANVGWGANLFSIAGDGQMISFPTYNTFTTTNAANVYVNSSGSFFRSTSSIKYKTQVEDLDPSYADKLLDLRPVWYRSTCEADRKDWSWYGFIAEEMAAIEPRFVEYKQNEDGTLEPEGVQYSRIVVPLVALVKKQQQQINDLTARLSALEQQANGV